MRSFLTAPAALFDGGPTHQHEFTVGDTVTSAAAGHVHDLSVPGVIGPPIPLPGAARIATAAELEHEHAGAWCLNPAPNKPRAKRLRQAAAVAAAEAERDGLNPGLAIRRALSLPPAASLAHILPPAAERTAPAE